MRLHAVLIAAALASPVALAHDDEGEHHKPSNHAKKDEHKDAPRSFAEQPAPGTWAKCPVSGDIFKVGKDTQFSTHGGRVYALCCDQCKPDFDKDPAKYADSKK